MYTSKKSINNKIAFIGTPNVGKSSIINKLILKNKLATGNWNGVTVGKGVVFYKYKNKNYKLIDLPGIYSFYQPTKNEKIAIKELFSNKYNLFLQIINVVDLKSSLHLTLLLKELNLPFAVILNFSDRAKKFNYKIDIKKLERILKVDFLLTNIYENNFSNKVFSFINNVLSKKLNFLCNKTKCCSNKSKFKDNKNNFTLKSNPLSNLISNSLVLNNYKKPKKFFWYSNLLNKTFSYIEKLIKKFKFSELEKNFFIQGIMENNSYAYEFANLNPVAVNCIINNLENYQKKYNFQIDNELFLKRNNYIDSIINVSTSKKLNQNTNKITKFLDFFFLNKALALPCIFLILLFLFILIFNFTTPYKNLISDIFTIYLPHLLHIYNKNTWWSSFLINGLFNGVGVLFSFAPVMYLLFIVINFLQQSGLISRFTFAFNSFMRRIGLSGKSFIPLLLGFGCNVTSIYATRIIESEHEKKVTAMVSPFISCSARLIVFALFTSIFFSKGAGLIIFSLYLIGILVALMMAAIFKFFNKYKSSSLGNDFIDLPPYQMPHLKSIIAITNYNLKKYIKKVTFSICFFVAIVWVLGYFPHGNNLHPILYYLHYAISPIFIPLGFGISWQLCVSIIPGIISKEITIGTIATLFAITTTVANAPNFGKEICSTFHDSFVNLLPNHWFSANAFQLSGTTQQLSLAIQQSLTNNGNLPLSIASLSCYSYMVFVLLTVPCITTLSSLKSEYGLKTMLQSLFLGLAIPYITSLFIFQLLYHFLK